MKDVSLKESTYPPLLKEISNPPEKVYFIGDWPDFQKPWIAIVGTRKATLSGLALAKKIAKDLAEAGAVIVSGLAMGVDTAAHEGALLGNGKTVAVLAGGLDNIYPAQNINLAKKIIASRGALISEYAPSTPNYKNQFLERNRIVSGLCVATIVIEAPERSGSLATARFAAEQGREVLVIPGDVHSSNYRGSHQLIRDGARLASSIPEIFEDLGLEKIKNNQIDLNEKITSDEQKIVLALRQTTGANVDKIIEITDLEPQVVNKLLSFLIIKGVVKETTSGFIII